MGMSRSEGSIGGAVPYDADATERGNLSLQMTGKQFDEHRKRHQEEEWHFRLVAGAENLAATGVPIYGVGEDGPKLAAA